MIHGITDRLEGKRILIAGFGREGRSTFSFIKNHMPDAQVAVADRNAKAFEGLTGIETYSGDSYLECISDFDVVVKTPGLSLLGVDCHGVEITSQTDLFLTAFHNQVVGITGTKGKSTTSSLIYHVVKSAGRDCILAGNIGIPVLDIVDNVRPCTTVVYELSAHQLQYIARGPHIGILLNVFEEHLDHFGTFERYREAKLNIVKFMHSDDYAIVGHQLSDERSRAHLVEYECCDVDVDWIRVPLRGEHNQMNIRAAVCACRCLGMHDDAIVPALYDFKPLEHRLEYVGKFNGVEFVNDSISTIPQATIMAVKTLRKVDFLLLGGFDRGIDYTPLIEFLASDEIKIKNILYTGEAGKRVCLGLSKKDISCNAMLFNNMDEAFEIIASNAVDGDVCLLSPAAASYDQYKNFEERGAKFKEKAAAFRRKL